MNTSYSLIYYNISAKILPVKVQFPRIRIANIYISYKYTRRDAWCIDIYNVCAKHTPNTSRLHRRAAGLLYTGRRSFARLWVRGASLVKACRRVVKIFEACFATRKRRGRNWRDCCRAHAIILSRSSYIYDLFTVRTIKRALVRARCDLVPRIYEMCAARVKGGVRYLFGQLHNNSSLFIYFLYINCGWKSITCVLLQNSIFAALREYIAVQNARYLSFDPKVFIHTQRISFAGN